LRHNVLEGKFARRIFPGLGGGAEWRCSDATVRKVFWEKCDVIIKELYESTSTRKEANGDIDQLSS
jgi:hypothetical protein